MTATCSWCRECTTAPVRVGIIGGDSGPGGTVYACAPCRAEHRILPLDQQEDTGDGRPQSEARDG